MRLNCLPFIFFATAAPAFSQMSITLNEDDHFVMSGEVSNLLAIELRSGNEAIIPGAARDGGPFDVVPSNSKRMVVYGSLGHSVDLSGDLVLPARLNTTVENDVFFQYGTDTESFALSPIQGNPNDWNAADWQALFPTQEPIEPRPMSESDITITIGLSPLFQPNSVATPEPSAQVLGGFFMVFAFVLLQHCRLHRSTLDLSHEFTHTR